MALQHFDTKSFDAALAEGKLMMVDFWANWCMLGKVDVDEQGELAMRYGVMSIPTVIFFKDGKEIRREVGALPKDVFVNILKENL